MFKKNQEKEKTVNEIPEPKKIAELEEATQEEIVEEVSKTEETEEQSVEKEPEAVAQELTEDQVKLWMRDVANILASQEKRIARIEHHLRLDFE